MWWTTDEPYHWEDWLALQFFTRLWTTGRKQAAKPAGIWTARADISRPQWQGRVLEGIVDQVYYGGFQDWRQSKRARIISSDQDIGIRAYGNAGDHWQPNTATVLKFVNAWLDGADGFLTWQTIGNNRSLDVQESCQGNALFVPGDRFGLPVVGDLRIKAIRNAEQFIEYLVMLQKKFGYSRPQIKSTLMNVLSLDPDEKQIRGLNNEQLYKLRRLIVELIADS